MAAGARSARCPDTLCHHGSTLLLPVHAAEEEGEDLALLVRGHVGGGGGGGGAGVGFAGDDFVQGFEELVEEGGVWGGSGDVG